MKRLFIIIPLLVICSSCENTWDSETKDMYLQSCKEEATWAKNEQDATVYCDCMLDNIMKKYPQVSDFMEHVQDVMADTTLRDCRTKLGY